MKKLYVSFLFLVLFIGFTLCVWLCDRAPIGPNGSIVGFSTLNKWFSSTIGFNMILYKITDWAGILPVATAIIYGFIGLYQWIKRKKIKNVDSNILLLGGFYLLIFAIYMLFNYVVINYRPLLINGYLEPSFPSSTTLMSITFIMLSNYQINVYIKNKKTKGILSVLSIIFMLFLVVGRIISGVHWITDIIASILLSISILFIYQFLCDKCKLKTQV